MHVTRHAQKRIRERNGANKKAVYRIAEKALKEGIPHSRTKGRLNKWITGIYFQNKKVNNIRIYGDKAYLFSDEFLITVLQIPAYITKDLKEMIISEEEAQKRSVSTWIPEQDTQNKVAVKKSIHQERSCHEEF